MPTELMRHCYLRQLNQIQAHLLTSSLVHSPTLYSHLLRRITELMRHCHLRQLNQIHAHLLTSSLVHSPTLYSHLLRRITELSSMLHAELLFSYSPAPVHVLLYNAMIRGYVHHGPYERSIQLFDEMPQRDLRPNNYTYPYALGACCNLDLFETGRKVQCMAIKDGFDSFPSVGASLLNYYLNFEELLSARRIFDSLVIKSIGLWNKMVSEYMNVGDVESARKLFEEMPEKNVVSWNSMLSGYARASDLESARALFRRMPEKDVVSWTSMIGASAKIGDLKSARKLFDEMPERNVVSWNCMLSGYTQHGMFEQALNFFLRMQSEGMAPDGFTFVSALSACAHLGALEIGKWIHFNLISDELQLGAIVGTSLIEMYAKCGHIDRAFIIFLKTVKKDIFSWNVMIRALAIHGKTDDAMKLFATVKKDGLKLNDYTFMSLLFACSHGGLVEDGHGIFNDMEREFKIRPKIEHYGCLIDMLCRNGRLEEAHAVMKKMPYEPDVAIWGALLGGCRTRNDLESAEKAMEMVTEFKTSGSGVFVLLSNLYAASSQWNEALMAREKMEQKNICKITGHSSVLEAADIR